MSKTSDSRADEQCDKPLGLISDRPLADGILSEELLPGQISTSHYAALLKVRSATKVGNSVLFEVDDALLRIDVLASDLIRLKLTRTGTFDEAPTCAVSADTSMISASFEIIDTSESYILTTSQMSVVIGREPFCIDAYRSDGSVIFESTRYGVDASGAYLYLNDDFVVSRKYQREDAIYGLGEKTGHFNRKGRAFTLWNTDVLNPDASGRFTNVLDVKDPRRDPTSIEFDPYYMSIPFFHHLDATTGNAAGFFIDNGYLSRFDFLNAEEYRFQFCGGEYTEYVFAGPSLKSIISRYTELTGRIEAPPIWALGYHQCRWHTYTQSDLVNIAFNFRKKSIPCDTLWLDIEHMQGYRVFTWDEKVFPDLPEFLKLLSERKLRVITIIDPGVKSEKGYCVYDSGTKQNAFCRTAGGNIYTGHVWPGRSAFPDFSLPDVRQWWGDLNAAHVQSGIAGIWNDMNEPATGSISELNMRFGNGIHPHERFHNQYGMLMAMSTQEGLLRAMPEKRTFILSRAGFAGIQRYAANWMGDNVARWDHLWLSMPMAMGLGMSGQPFVGADIGGFGEDTNPELFARWMQCGALTPFCRNHNNAGCIDQYPWSFGKTVQSLVRKSIEMRYRLMPYLYSAFVDASETGLPIQKPLALEYQDDPTARDVEDQYLLGAALMVAPVYTAGSTARQIYLPDGEWRGYSTEERLVGSSFVIEPTPMDRIPLFVKAGAIIPMWPEAPLSTMDYHPTTIELHIYTPTADGQYVSTLHEDDGITFGYRDGHCYKTVLTLSRSGNHMTLKGETSGNGYPEFRRRQFGIVFHGSAPSSIGTQSSMETLRNGVVILPNSGESFELTFTIGGGHANGHMADSEQNGHVVGKPVHSYAKT